MKRLQVILNVVVTDEEADLLIGAPDPERALSDMSYTIQELIEESYEVKCTEINDLTKYPEVKEEDPNAGIH